MCYKLIEIKPREVWQIDSTDGQLSVDKYEAQVEGQEYNCDDAYFTIPRETPYFNVTTKLDENDQIVREDLSSVWAEYDIRSLEDCVARIIEKSKSIEAELKYAIIKGSIEKEDFDKALVILNDANDSITSLLSALYGP